MGSQQSNHLDLVAGLAGGVDLTGRVAIGVGTGTGVLA